MTLDLEGLLTALTDANVDFVLVGGLAAVAHGSARVTYDVDILYARTSENIARLCTALGPHHVYLRGAPEGLPFRFDVETVRRGLNFTLSTDLGPIDCFGEIVGGGTWEALAPTARRIEVFGKEVLVLTLDQLIDAKRAAGRPKDLEVLAELEALREESEG